MTSGKSYCSLFSALLISSLTRGDDFEDLFMHKNQKFPVSLSENGRIRSCQKSDTLKCLEKIVKMNYKFPPRAPDVFIVDAAVVVNCVQPKSSKT